MARKKSSAMASESVHPLLKRKLPAAARKPVAILPSLISPSPHAVRLPPFDDAEYATLVQTMKFAGKNLIPSAVRTTTQGKYELLYGHRRWAAASELNMKLHCLVMNVDDADLPYFIDWENSGRASPRPYRVGCIFRRWLADGVFANQNALAHQLGRSEGHVSDMLSLAHLPEFVIDAFPNSDDLTTRHAKRLKDACKKDVELMKARAQQIHQLRANGELPTVHKVYRILTGQESNEIEETSTEKIRPSNRIALETDHGEAGYAVVRKGELVVRLEAPVNIHQARALAMSICLGIDAEASLFKFKPKEA